MMDAETRARIAQLVAEAPPLSDRQREIIRANLGVAATRGRRVADSSCDDAATYGKVAS